MRRLPPLPFTSHTWSPAGNAPGFLFKANFHGPVMQTESSHSPPSLQMHLSPSCSLCSGWVCSPGAGTVSGSSRTIQNLGWFPRSWMRTRSSGEGPLQPPALLLRNQSPSTHKGICCLEVLSSLPPTRTSSQISLSFFARGYIRFMPFPCVSAF